MTRFRSGGPRRRGQSETIGIVLVFGLVILGASATVVFGASALSESQDSLEIQRAEKSMTQFDSKSALVALGSTKTQAIEFPRGGSEQLNVDKSAGELKIELRNLSGGPDRSTSWDLGKLIYSKDQTEIAYQGGGVWRRSSESGKAVMVSPPEFHFRGGTLTLPVITVDGDSDVGESLSVSAGSSSTTWHPDLQAGWPNPLNDHKVFVNVTSEYYRGWGAYFEARTDGSVTYDHPNNRVILELVTPIGQRQVRAASTSLAPAGRFEITGTSGNPCGGGLGPASNRPYADSYDSEGTTDNYCDQKSGGNTGTRGNITYGDAIDISMGSGGSAIKGSVRSGGSVSVSPSMGAGQPYVDGDIFYTTTCNGKCDARSTGDVNQISGIREYSDISSHVSNIVDDSQSDNDNGATGGTISSNSLVYNEPSDPDPADTATLTSGTYFLERIDVGSGQTLAIDTTSGPVTIAVEDFVDVSGRIQVSGDQIVRVYIKGESSLGSGENLRVSGGGDVHVVGDDAPELRFYGQDDLQVSISDGELTGVIYAPPGPSGTSDLHIDHGALFGGAVVADTTIDTQGSIHYDEALRNQQIVSRDAKVITITYLHISKSQIKISG